MSILVRPGNIISTITKVRNMYAKAVVSEQFDKEFSFYDLGKFLSILSMFDKPELTFEDKFVTIHQGKRKVRFVYAERLTLVVPPDKVPDVGATLAQFQISESAISNVIKAAGVLGLPEVRLKCDGSASVEFEAFDATEPNRNNFIETIDVDTNAPFSVSVKTDCLKMMPSDYEVTVAERALIMKGSEVEYLMAIQP